MNVREEIYRQFAAQVAAAHDRLALDMILRGMLPSQGWKIGYHLELEGTIYRHTCFPLPPR